MAQADRISTLTAAATQIAEPADVAEARRIALLRRMWADHNADGSFAR